MPSARPPAPGPPPPRRRQVAMSASCAGEPRPSAVGSGAPGPASARPDDRVERPDRRVRARALRRRRPSMRQAAWNSRAPRRAPQPAPSAEHVGRAGPPLAADLGAMWRGAAHAPGAELRRARSTSVTWSAMSTTGCRIDVAGAKRARRCAAASHAAIAIARARARGSMTLPRHAAIVDTGAAVDTAGAGGLLRVRGRARCRVDRRLHPPVGMYDVRVARQLRGERVHQGVSAHPGSADEYVGASTRRRSLQKDADFTEPAYARSASRSGDRIARSWLVVGRWAPVQWREVRSSSG
jgi:hypothetical protein